jgi:hypothetical protein
MNKYVTASKAKQVFTAQQMQNGPHPGPATVMPTHKDIARRAYEIYIENGRRQGQSEQYWLQAEQELKNRKHWLQAEQK